MRSLGTIVRALWEELVRPELRHTGVTRAGPRETLRRCRWALVAVSVDVVLLAGWRWV